MQKKLEPQLDQAVHQSRLQLIWQVIVFQIKLVADGLRDVILVPVSLIAALLGLVAGGSDPGRLFRRVMLWGQKSEHWLNLFGHRRHGTADNLLDPLKDKVDTHPMAQKAGESLNKGLDRVNQHLND